MPPGIGEGIEGDVHPAIGGQIVGAGLGPFQQQAIAGDALGREALSQALALGRAAQLRRLQQQAAVRQGLQNGYPQGQHLIVELAQIVEAAEGQSACAQGGQCADGNVELGWRETEECLGQAQQRFAEAVLQGRRRDPRVGQEVVHLGQAGAGAIAEPAHLQGRGLPGEQGQAVARRVAGQVEQDVDRVLVMDLRGESFIGQAQHRMPGAATGPDPRAQVVFVSVVGIDDELDAAGAPPVRAAPIQQSSRPGGCADRPRPGPRAGVCLDRPKPSSCGRAGPCRRRCGRTAGLVPTGPQGRRCFGSG